MKLLFILFTFCLAQGQAFPNNEINPKAFHELSQIKQIFLLCDIDRNGELDSDEFSICVSFLNIFASEAHEARS